jgi:predicted TIM-barrel fold metal-dependent hydrolase
VIVDFHTHIFPPEVIRARDDFARRDPTFAELYGNPSAKLATAEDLLASMERAYIDVSVVLGFAWSELDDCRRHNDYILEAAARSRGRLVPFCMTQPRDTEGALGELARCAAAGARGIGELRPENQGYSILDSPEELVLVEAARRLGLILLFHVTEPFGHLYPGKQGLHAEEFAAFVERHRDIKVVGAHWAGGVPFFGAMPEVRSLFQSVWFDTAATSLLYSNGVYNQVISAVGSDAILFGSDFPLLSQKQAADRAEAAGLSLKDRARVLGGNAARLLDLS